MYDSGRGTYLPECGGPMHVMNCNTRRELVVVPAKVFIRE